MKNNELIASDFESAQLQWEQWGTKRFSNKFNETKQASKQVGSYERQEIDNLTTDWTIHANIQYNSADSRPSRERDREREASNKTQVLHTASTRESHI